METIVQSLDQVGIEQTAIEELKNKIAPLLDAADSRLQEGDFAEAAELYKSVLRSIRDVFGPCHLLIADVFEKLSEVHEATGKPRKCLSIRRRVLVIRARCTDGDNVDVQTHR